MIPAVEKNTRPFEAGAAKGELFMSEFSRRELLGGAVAAAAATSMWSEPVHAQYVWQKADWHAAEFEALSHSTRKIRLAVHGFLINDSRVLKNAKNALNGVRFGSGVAADQIQVVCALNGPANLMNYSDYVWEKYRIGAWLKENDPKTGEPAMRNIFYPAKAGASMHYASEDPSSDDSLYQDYSVQALLSRGVRFLSCHSSTEETARALVKLNGLSAQPEEIVKDIHAHALPGVLIVPALSGALAQLQCDGNYAYMSAG